MMRLIDADALKIVPNKLKNGVYVAAPRCGKTLNNVMCAFQKMVDYAPTIDAVPVRHGRWAYGYYPTVWYGSGEPPEWICSLCHDRAYNTYDYCPNCGAKMEVGAEECR